MEIIRGLENLKAIRPCAVTIGTFDGVHPGHLKIVEQLIVTADRGDLCSTLVTFDPHPQLVLNPEARMNIKLLSTIDEKLEILKSINLNRTIIIEFDKSFAQQSYEEFVKNILIDKIGAKAIVVGYDHAFGRDRAGNYDNLVKLSEKYGFALIRVEPFKVEGQILSSTLVRTLITEGRVALAAEYLGRPYSISGQVIRGNSRGKNLNFPTANLKIENENKLIPREGVYAVDVNYNNSLYKGMLNIGNQPTFGSEGRFSIEAHIFNFKKDIYREYLKIGFKTRLRDEQRFESPAALIAQLEIDKKNSLKL